MIEKILGSLSILASWNSFCSLNRPESVHCVGKVGHAHSPDLRWTDSPQLGACTLVQRPSETIDAADFVLQQSRDSCQRYFVHASFYALAH